MSTNELELELSLILPETPNLSDPCPNRLTDALARRPGVEKAHVVIPKSVSKDENGDSTASTTNNSNNAKEARLCIHYDPAIISMERLREITRAIGAELSARYTHLRFNISSDRRQNQRRVEQTVRQVIGVLEAEASETGWLRVEFDTHAGDINILRRTLAKFGASEQIDGSKKHLSRETQHDRNHDRHEDDGEKHDDHQHGRIETLLEIGSAGLGAILWILAIILGYFEITPAVTQGLYLAVYATTGLFVARDALRSWFSGRLEIDSLMIAAAGGAAVLGALSEGALLLVLFAIGHALEGYAMKRAKRAIGALGGLAPKSALVVTEDGEKTVAIDELVVGDRIRVLAHQRIPSDGIVALGSGAVNEAPITGESVPVDKEPANQPSAAIENWQQTDRRHRVFAGSLNEDAALEILVARLASDSTLARLVKMVSEAQTQKSPTQQLTDRFERFFVPTVLVGTGLLFFAWLVIDETFASSAYRALAVLVAASPCALAIATPSAVLSGIARAGQRGVLIKGGGPLEALGQIRAIAFDKTGTLTQGEPTVTELVPIGESTMAEVASIALALEKTSEHPLARALIRDLSAPKDNSYEITEITEVSQARVIIGRGLAATIAGETAWAGSPRLFTESSHGAPPLEPPVQSIVDRLEKDGRTIVIVAHGTRVVGVIGLIDEPRETAATTIQSLRNSGIETIVMLSGDNQKAATAIAKAIGITDARGEMMPEDKVSAIKELASNQGGVAMIGDGVNDAPAMATASVGIAMGAAGSDVALETADIALMSDDLAQLTFAINLSKKSSHIIRQNLLVSLGVVALLIPATIVGLGIGPAVIAHEGSTLVVVANALRLLKY